MSESVSVLLVALFLVAMHGAAHDLSPRRAAVIGALVGLATLARSELVLLAPGAALVLLLVDSHVTVAHAPVGDRTDDGTDRRARGADLKRPAVLLVVAAMVVAPWVAFNLARFERPVTLSTNDGTTLLGTYCDRTFSGSQKGGWSLFCVTEDDPAYSADEEPSVRSARQRSLAIAYARGHLSELPGVVAARLGRTFDLYGLRSLVDQDIGEERSRSASWAGIVAWWMLAVVALFGFRRVRRRDRQILLLPVVAVLVTTIVFYGGHRIRSSMEPTVVVFAAIALAAWAKRTEKTGATTATGTATGTAAEAVTGTATG